MIAARKVVGAFVDPTARSIRGLRLARGWSQSSLANALKTSQSHVARIERGTENVTIETCRKLCQSLEIDMNALDLILRAQESAYVAKRANG
jgi:transcriptional regulator with XRE-family HTH domain